MKPRKTKAVCPNCGAMETMIVTTYMHTDGYRVRRRHCTHCEQRFYTVQPPEKLLQPGTKAWYTRVKTCPQRLR